MKQEHRLRRPHRFATYKEEEYAAELTPRGLHFQADKDTDLLTEKTNIGIITGYVALFLALFSVAFYPVIFGSLAVAIGLLAVRYNAKTLGYTAIVFGGFSVLFSILYPLIVFAFY
ncbi:MAG: permease [Ectobacillus sp.]